MPPLRAVELALESPAAARSVAPRPSMRIENTNQCRIDDSLRPEKHDLRAGTSESKLWLAARARVDRVPDSVAQEIEGERRHQDREPRPDHQPRLGRVVRGRGREQVAPAGILRVDAEPEEGE